MTFTVSALQDVHKRAHYSLSKMLDHCESLSAGEFTREVEGFGIPSVRRQLHHIVSAERYWLGVLNGQMLVDDDDTDSVDVPALGRFRESIFDVTENYLKQTNEEAINTLQQMVTYGDKQVELLPALVVLRTQTHIFQHIGQVAAMCRGFGKPIPRGMDFPVGNI
ncbi:MAG: DinB family protein [Planctomycetota bacterium]|jgi:uncharacterized damage-inducible protein DinB